MYRTMRVHLPALIALVSATTYVACGSSDPSKAQQAGGEGGAGGEAPSSAGKSNTAGSQNGGGSKNNAGEAGMTSGGVPANAGAAGSEAGGAGAAGESAGGMSSAGGAPPDGVSLPTACPGPASGYTLVTGTATDDHFLAADVSGTKLVFGLDGADIFDLEHGGNDCLVGGPGDDDFTNPDEFANYYVGGPGADTYHISTTGNFVRIADMEPDDEIRLSQTKFTFLAGAAGDTVSDTQLILVPGYSLGASSGVVEASSLVFDSSEGELWLDVDGGAKGVNDRLILTILNHDDYNFDPDDFVIE
jgi:hypothetical protein